MILHPVLMPVPKGDSLPRHQRATELRRVSRLALAESARLSGISVREWRQAESGEPLPTDGVYWSVAHKPLWTAAVVSDRPVGIDLEPVAPRRVEMFDALAAEEEWSLLRDREWLTFCRLWTAKEAVLKANGVGIGRFGDCKLTAVKDREHMQLSFEGRDWRIQHCYFHDHVAAVTVESSKPNWTVMGDDDEPL